MLCAEIIFSTSAVPVLACPNMKIIFCLFRMLVFAPQINGRTPDVNITSISGWSVETMFGYGYEILLMEELNDAG